MIEMSTRERSKIRTSLHFLSSKHSNRNSNFVKNIVCLEAVIMWIGRCDTGRTKKTLLEWFSSGNLVRGTDYQLTIKRKLQPVLPVLLHNNGDVNYVDKDNRTILFYCIVMMKNVKPFDSYDGIFDLELITRLCKLGASISIADCNGNSPLGLALRKQRMDLVNVMFCYNCTSILESNQVGQTVLHIIIQEYSIDKSNCKMYYKFIKDLICKEADLNKPDDNGVTPVHLVAKSLDVKLLKVFKKCGANLYAQTSDGENVLTIACKYVTEEIDKTEGLKLIKWLLDEEGFSLNFKNKHGYTPVHYLARSSDFALVNILIKDGVNLNAVANDNTNPLHSVIMSSSFEVLQCFVKLGVEITRRDNVYGFSLIHMAAFSYEVKILEWLVQEGFHPNEIGKCDLTPLHVASMIGNAEMVKKLIEYDANVLGKEKIYNYTALHLASMRGKFATIQKIIAREVDNQEMKGNRSFISQHCSSFRLKANSKMDYKATTAALLKAGAEINAKDKYGCTPLHYATRQSSNDLIEVLLSAGAHVDAQDNRCSTPLHNCLLHANDEGLKCLLIHGANINDLEHACQNTLTKVNKSDNLTILEQVVKLNIAGLPVNNVYRRYLGSKNVQKYVQYSEELTKLKKRMLERNISLYDLLHINFRRRATFANNLPSDLDTEFPRYAILIRNKCTEAVNRMILMEPAVIAFRSLTGIPWPDICVDRILSFLDNGTLRILNFNETESQCLNILTKNKSVIQT